MMLVAITNTLHPVNYGIKPYFIFSNVPEVEMDEFGSLQMLNFCTKNNLS